MRVGRVGTGAGARDPEQLPNVVRLVLGEPGHAGPAGPVVLESHVDDLDPRLWPGVLDRVKQIRRLPWVVLSQNAQLLALDGDTLTISLVNAGARDSFVSTGSVDVLRQALQEVLGVSWNVDAIVDPTATPGADAPPPQSAQPAAKRGTSAPESVKQAVKDGPPAELDDPDAAARPDDPVIDSNLDPEQLVATELGGKVIDE